MIKLDSNAHVAVTGARGRLGSAVVAALEGAGVGAIGWSRPHYDLDDSGTAERLIERDGPDLVIHCAGWVDVDGCARDPDLAIRRNGDATRELAEACSTRQVPLLYVSTNEVFDGRRDDGHGYTEADAPNPPNPYGASKLKGELAAAAAFSGTAADLWIVRTAWLFGASGNDFPSKIIAAADRLDEDASLRVVSDEFGNPTHTAHLAVALMALVRLAPPGTYHLASTPPASRYEWARDVLATARPTVRVEPISRAEYQRASEPPAWGVLDSSRAEALGVHLDSWKDVGIPAAEISS